MSELWDTIKLLSDSTRARILIILNDEELSVAELQASYEYGSVQNFIALKPATTRRFGRRPKGRQKDFLCD